jgi:invasion protein IalB
MALLLALISAGAFDGGGYAIAEQRQAAPAAQLPNGATSLNETHGDWTIDCRVIEGQKQCVLDLRAARVHIYCRYRSRRLPSMR